MNEERENLEEWFRSKHKNMLNFRRIVGSPEMVSFLEWTTILTAEKRLGGSKDMGFLEEVKKHDWFTSLDWTMLEARKIESPLSFDRRRASVRSGALDLSSEAKGLGRAGSVREAEAEKG